MPPFSTKQKKQQLQEKRKNKRERGDDPNSFFKSIMQKTHFNGKPVGQNKNKPINANAASNGGGLTGGVGSSNREKFADLEFFKDFDNEIKERKERAMLPIIALEPISLEIDASTPMSALDMPKRPPWNKTFSKDQLNNQEQIYFKNFVSNLIEQANLNNEKLSYFDLNLDTWRQLWRVVEMSELIVIIVDIRHPLFHFPPSLYRYIVNDLKKMVIVVLNKIDLVCASLVIAWQDYLKSQYPEVHVIPFASYAGVKTKSNGKRVGNMKMAADGAKRFMHEVERMVGPGNVDFSLWKEKMQNDAQEDLNDPNDFEEDNDDSEDQPSNAFAQAKQIKVTNNTDYYVAEKYKDGILTIGCVGHPNVGKSSFMNALYGKKVVSVSRTPGHTKHFQTIFLTENIKLCDCPGLVFPSYFPKQLQVLMGCYPISQLREPYSSIQYLAERVDVVRKLKLKPVDEIRHQRPALNDALADIQTAKVTNEGWSAWAICESWAVLRGFLTARAGRPDVYRAANHLLRMALDGRTLCMAFYPPDYISQKETNWDIHEEIEKIAKIQGRHNIINDDNGY